MHPALGDTDTMAGWRKNKARGGVLIAVPRGEIIAHGLSMPHSPRWHAGRLWVCESRAKQVNALSGFSSDRFVVLNHRGSGQVITSG